jgi:hypothetical protein
MVTFGNIPKLLQGFGQWVRRSLREPVMRSAILHVHGREKPQADPAFLKGRMADEANDWLSRLMKHMSDEEYPIHEVRIGFSLLYPGINAYIGSDKHLQPVRFHTPYDDVPTSSLDDAHMPYLRNVMIDRGDFQTFAEKDPNPGKKQPRITFALYKIHSGRYLSDKADVTAFIPIDDPSVAIRLMMHPQILQHRIKGSIPSIPPSSGSF